MHKYRLIGKKGEGTFSEVLKAQSIKSGKYFAIKCMKNYFDSIDQVNNLREIQALRRLAGHPNIIKLHEVLYDEPTGRLALVFELMDMNLYEAIKGRRHYLPEQKVKQYMYELLKALDHMHRNGIFHRDVKPENLLLLDDEIKLADLGSCRGIYSRQPYTEYISTRWYRAPECLLTDGYYNFKMDLFAAGCVWFEIVALFPLFPGQNEMDQIQKIHNILGTPNPELLAKFKRNASHMDFNFPEKKGTGIERLVPHANPEIVDLIKKLIRYDPDERLLARQALKDPFFRELRDAEKDKMSGTSQFGENKTDAHVSRSSAFRDAAAKACMSTSSSNASIGPADDAEESAVPPAQPANEASTHSAAVMQETTSSFASRKGGGAGVGQAKLPLLQKDAVRKDDASESEAAELEDSTILPPIAGGGAQKAAGAKAARDTKGDTKRGPFKNAAASSLQKPSIHAQTSRGLGVHGVAKGYNPNSTTQSIGAGAMSSSYAQNWNSGSNDPAATLGPGRGPAGGGGGADEMEKMMHSTWAPSQQSRKYVSPFAQKRGDAPSAKKR
mmetsp:Transcript_8155/g.19150  ORF Transcript_8155/g.19150 Transcript_8155/m.19150 type:complete len:556 (-) Transcript_8155:120-1787(-)